MKNKTAKINDEEMRPEYDFSNGIRGKYADEFKKGTNIILLDPDLIKLFPDSESVNRALRSLAEIAKTVNPAK